MVDWPIITEFCLQALRGSEPKQIVTVNGEIILEADRNPIYKEVINKADMNIPDSTNVYWVSQLKGQLLPMITPGSDLVIRLAELATKNSYSIFLLGGRGDVPEKAASALKKQFSNLKIAGTSNTNPHDQTVLKQIQTSQADILLVAYGAPKQEFWIAEHKSKLPTRILVGVGGTFDMLAGVLPRAPQIFRLLHLEWLWRVIIQPSRLSRVFNAVVVFPLKALFS